MWYMQSWYTNTSPSVNGIARLVGLGELERDGELAAEHGRVVVFELQILVLDALGVLALARAAPRAMDRLVAILALQHLFEHAVELLRVRCIVLFVLLVLFDVHENRVLLQLSEHDKRVFDGDD